MDLNIDNNIDIDNDEKSKKFEFNCMIWELLFNLKYKNCESAAFKLELDQKYIDYIANFCSVPIHQNEFHNTVLAHCKTNDIEVTFILDPLNLEIMKYLINACAININYVSTCGNSCLMLACRYNANQKIIQYLIEEHKMNVNHVNKRNDNCLLMACMYNTDLKVIEYLIDVQKMDTSYINEDDNDCLTLACSHNPNLKIIEYLIDVCDMDINTTGSDCKYCLTLACKNKSKSKIIEYLLKNDNLDLDLQIYDMTDNVKDQILMIIKNNIITFNRIVKCALNHIIRDFSYDFYERLRNMCLKYNPLLFDQDNIYCLRLPNPYKKKYDFNTFMTHVNELKLSHVDSISNNCPVENKVDVDFTHNSTHNSESNELLFTHNNIAYYGNRDIVYKSIFVLNDIMDLCSKDEPDIILSGKLPIYLMNKYIASCYGKKIDFSTVNLDDFEEFITFIDKYPSTHLSIDSLEKQIIEYLKKHEIKTNTLLVMLSKRYKLKKLFLYLHL